jgi:hypothetical protein
MQAITDKMLFTLPDFMASSNGRKSDNQRPRPLQLSKSFSRIGPASPDLSTRTQRASTIQNGVAPKGAMVNKSSEDRRVPADAFEKSSEDSEESGNTEEEPAKLPDDFDELPIELASLSDRYVFKEFRGPEILILPQLHRITICQGSSNPTHCRQAIWTVPGFLYSCCDAYKYPHLCIVFSSASREFTCTLYIITILYREQVKGQSSFYQ